MAAMRSCEESFCQWQIKVDRYEILFVGFDSVWFNGMLFAKWTEPKYNEFMASVFGFSGAHGIWNGPKIMAGTSSTKSNRWTRLTAELVVLISLNQRTRCQCPRNMKPINYENVRCARPLHKNKVAKKRRTEKARPNVIRVK